MVAGAWRICAAAIAAFLLCCWSDARAERRVALVIGNAAYENAARLPNTVPDANAVADLLATAGFEVVTVHSDLGNLAFKRAVREFSETVHSADIAVLFYAGHGVEIGGMNYLVPTDAILANDYDAEDEAVPLDRVMRALAPARRLRLVILDACRDSPFARKVQRTTALRAMTAGLAKVEPATPNTLIAFAARAGSTAEDGDGPHSPFTAALLKHLTQPGLDVQMALRRVRDEVLRDTGNRQEPFVYGSLGGAEVPLVPGPAAPPARTASDIRKDYELAERIGSRDAWEAFLSTYPTGYYSELARLQLGKIEREARLELEQRHERARITREQADRAERERLAREQAERERLAEQARQQAEREQAERKRLAEQVERERLADEQARQQAERQQAERERLAREQLPSLAADQSTGPGGEVTGRIQTAMATPPNDPSPARQAAALSGAALVSEIKKELARVGCYTGQVDGEWGTRDTRSALDRFVKHASLSTKPHEPAVDLLEVIRGRTDRVCPLECGAREIERDGKCVAKACPRGSGLASDGTCEKRSRPADRRKEPVKTASRHPAPTVSPEPAPSVRDLPERMPRGPRQGRGFGPEPMPRIGPERRPDKIPMDPGILRQEPGRGTMHRRQVVLVDDKSCPAGQIKQVWAGTRGIPGSRRRACVPRH
jgi:uncharacterized caspase-like protein